MTSVGQNFLIYSSALVFVPFLIAIVRFKKLAKPMRYLAVLIWLDFLTELTGHVLFFLKISNHFLWPIFISLEFALLAWIYKLELKGTVISKLILLIIILFIIYVLIDFINEGRGGLSAVPHCIEGVLILCFVLCYYFKSLQAPIIMHLELQPMFWLSTGLCIYFAADSIIFIFSNYIQSFSLNFYNQVWIVHAIFNILLYVFYTLAVCLTSKNRS